MKTKHATYRPPRRLGGVQQRFVRLQGVSGDVLCVGAPGTPPAYVGVLEVGGIAYDLKSQREQERLLDRWQQILAGITFPVQVLWRSLPLRLDPYLARFEPPPAAPGEATSVWETLAAAHVQHVRALADRRALLQRRVYLLTRVNADTGARRGVTGLFWPGPPRRAEAPALEQARGELSVRLSELAHRLDQLHLASRRLTGLAELGSFYQSCLTPLTAAQAPLAVDQFEGVDLPPQQHCPPAAPVPLIICPACQVHVPAWALFCGTCGTRFSEEKLMRFLIPRGTFPQAPVHQEPGASAGLDLPQRRYAIVPWHTPAQAPARQTLFPQLADLLAPASVEVTRDALQVGDEWQQMLVVRALPRAVEAGWLRPLLDLDEPFELSFQLRPEDSVRMEDLLCRKRTQFQATKLLSLGKGHLVDPHIEIALADIDDLMTKVASGAERMFDLFWLIRVWGATRKELADRVTRLQQVLRLMRLSAQVATYEQAPAYRSCLPQVRPQLDGGGCSSPVKPSPPPFPSWPPRSFTRTACWWG